MRCPDGCQFVNGRFGHDGCVVLQEELVATVFDYSPRFDVQVLAMHNAALDKDIS